MTLKKTLIDKFVYFTNKSGIKYKYVWNNVQISDLFDKKKMNIFGIYF